jgi:hypothetical protein
MKKYKLLIIYGIVIVIALVLIIFVLPDSFFERKYMKNYEEIMGGSETKEETPAEYVDLKTQKERLLKKNYTYSYQISAYVKKDETMTYNCKGTKLNGKEEGLCTKPDAISYNEKNISEKLKYVNQNYLDPEYVFNLIKDLDVEPYESYGVRIYTYKIKMSGVVTQIELYTDRENIVQIVLGSAKETYVMKYSEITY